jgi:hypothetical protein
MSTEKEYNRLAKRDCGECSGKGMVQYFFSHDDAPIAPCLRCFPNDSTAQRYAQMWITERRHAF